jgi:hypothetical protein
MSNGGDLGEYFPRLAVAAVDICGMKQLIGKEDNCTSAIKALALLVKNASVNKMYKDKSFKDEGVTIYELGDYFADSVYFFADASSDVGKQVDLLSLKCASLIAEGFLLGFPVRAGISVGDLRRKGISLYGGVQREVRIGKSMARAHILQESQNWIGGAVEAEFPPGPKEINRIKYEVPIKEDSNVSNSKLEAINWVYILAGGIIGKEKTKDEVIDMVNNTIIGLGDSESPETKSKLRNTLGFIEYVFSKPDYVPYTKKA